MSKLKLPGIRRKKRDKEFHILIATGLLTMLIIISTLYLLDLLQENNMIEQSKLSWLKETPIAITDIHIHRFHGNLTIQNLNPNKIIVKKIVFGGIPVWSGEIKLEPTEKKTIELSNISCKENQVLSFYKVLIQYNNKLEIGENKLVVRCE